MSSEGAQWTRAQHGGVPFMAIDIVTMVAAVVIAACLMVATQDIDTVSDELEEANERYFTCELAVNDLLEASSYLTTQSRLFSSTHHTAYLDNYYWAMQRSHRREGDVAVVQESYPGTDAAEHVEQALTLSKKLSKTELYSMKLVVSALDLEITEEEAALLDSIELRRGDDQLSSDAMLEKARELVSNEPYEHAVESIHKQIDVCKADLAELLAFEKTQTGQALDELLLRQRLLTVALLGIVILTAVLFIFTVARPLYEHIELISRHERLRETGSSELRFLARSFNKMFDETQNTRERLVREAEHDALTGLYNRGAFEKLFREACSGACALLLVDIDHFKDVNDSYGHDGGDRVLKRVAGLLSTTFRATDYPCRLGGDEFAVVMTNLQPGQRDVVERKMAGIARELRKADGDTCAATLSAGVAFGKGGDDPEAVYKKADEALYRVKNAGRDGIVFSDDAE